MAVEGRSACHSSVSWPQASLSSLHPQASSLLLSGPSVFPRGPWLLRVLLEGKLPSTPGKTGEPQSIWADVGSLIHS